MSPTAEQIAILNFSSLIISLVGTLIGGIFYLERRNNVKLDKQNAKIDKIDEKIDDKSEWLYNEMKGMEMRICSSMDAKIKIVERSIEQSTRSAKDLEDERMDNIHDRLRNLEK